MEDDEAIPMGSGFGLSAEGGLNEGKMKRAKVDHEQQNGRLPPIANQT